MGWGVRGGWGGWGSLWGGEGGVGSSRHAGSPVQPQKRPTQVSKETYTEKQRPAAVTLQTLSSLHDFFKGLEVWDDGRVCVRFKIGLLCVVCGVYVCVCVCVLGGEAGGFCIRFKMGSCVRCVVCIRVGVCVCWGGSGSSVRVRKSESVREASACVRGRESACEGARERGRGQTDRERLAFAPQSLSASPLVGK